jgi:hypothetical protein
MQVVNLQTSVSVPICRVVSMTSQLLAVDVMHIKLYEFWCFEYMIHVLLIIVRQPVEVKITSCNGITYGVHSCTLNSLYESIIKS